MITVQQANLLRADNINTLSLLAVLLACEQEIRVDDLCRITKVKRRTLEKQLLNRPDLLQRKIRYEMRCKCQGAPRSVLIRRTTKADRLIQTTFGQ